MIEVRSHGELNIFKVDEMPEGFTKVECNEDYKLADSESSGNHHMLEVNQNVEVFKKDDAICFVNTQPTNVYCVFKERHDTEEHPPGIYIVKPAVEYDYVNKNVVAVAD